MKTFGLGNSRNKTAASKSSQGDEVIDQKHVPTPQHPPLGNTTRGKSHDAHIGLSLILKDLAKQLCLLTQALLSVDGEATTRSPDFPPHSKQTFNSPRPHRDILTKPQKNGTKRQKQRLQKKCRTVLPARHSFLPASQTLRTAPTNQPRAGR